MCGVSGFTGLGYLSADLRFDLVEALGSGIDKRGGHAAGAVVVTEEGPPRLMRKLGQWDQARGRFIRAAANGHSVMMHARWATMGKKDEITNAHPFPIKRTDVEGKEVTLLYGCHNGMLQGTWETAKKNGRNHTVDSREFFELLADKAYETIRALSGYGVVTFIRPDDRKMRVIRLSSNSDFEIVRLKGGGLVWASTMHILSEALKYCGLEQEATLSVPTVGKVYVLSGTEAVETKLDGVEVCGNKSYSYCGYGDASDYDAQWDTYVGNNNRHSSNAYSGHNSPTSRHTTVYGYDKNNSCHKCGFEYFHATECHYNASKKPAMLKVEDWQRNRSQGKKEKKFSRCTDDTFRQVNDQGKLIPKSFPIYIREKTKKGPATGEYRAVFSLSQASHLSGVIVSDTTEVASQVAIAGTDMPSKGTSEQPGTEEASPVTEPLPPVLDAPKETPVEEVPSTTENGHWSMPSDISKEEQKEWVRFFSKSPALAMKLLEEAETFGVNGTNTVAIAESMSDSEIGKETEKLIRNGDADRLMKGKPSSLMEVAMQLAAEEDADEVSQAELAYITAMMKGDA